MKMPHKLRSQTAGPGWGLAFGAFMTAIGIAQGYYALVNDELNHLDGAIAVAATMIGVFAAVYSAREMRRGKRGYPHHDDRREARRHTTGSLAAAGLWRSRRRQSRRRPH
jgi:hypothetical protein